MIAVHQPHRYSRLRDLFEDFCGCFNEADLVVISEVFSAGEKPIPGADRDALVEGLRAHGHRHVLPLDGPEALPALLRDELREGDIVLCLGAGDITRWAAGLQAALEQTG